MLKSLLTCRYSHRIALLFNCDNLLWVLWVPGLVRIFGWIIGLLNVKCIILNSCDGVMGKWEEEFEICFFAFALISLELSRVTY